MNTNSLSSNTPSITILTKHSLPSTNHKPFLLPQRHSSLRFNLISCTSSSRSSSNNNNDDNDADSVQAPTADAEVGVRFRRRSSRRQSRQQQRENNGAVVSSGSLQSTRTKVSDTPKKWEDMSLRDKAIELYVGEKGALFWLNKFAYASIFIMIGAWILFRFVGPALNLYQLDSPPLSPSDVFKGSS